MISRQFPSTNRTWLHQRLAEEGPPDVGVLQHVMSRYAEPLAAFAAASSLRSIAEPNELVNGFFASQLGDPDYLHRWMEAGVPLRRWLVNGLILHARGVRRDATRDAGRRSIDDPLALEAADSAEAIACYERAWARRLLEVALEVAAGELRQRGKQRAFDLFRRHVIDGQPYAIAASSLRYSVAEARGVVRSVTKCVARALDQALREEGVPESELRREAARLHRLVQS